MDIQRKCALRESNAQAWAGETDIIKLNTSLDSSLKKNTAFIKRLRTAITPASLPTFLQEISSLSLQKYLSEVKSASYEGLTKVKTSGEIAASVEVISALHQRFGPVEYTNYLGWFLGRGLTTPDKAFLKSLSQDARDKEEKERLARQKTLLRVVTDLWLVGVLRTLEDVSRPEDAGAKGKENAGPPGSKLSDAMGKSKIAVGKDLDAEPFPLEVLKDVLGHDKDHIGLPLAVSFVKTFAWEILGVRSTVGGRAGDEVNEIKESPPGTDEDGQPSTAAKPSSVKAEMQQRFKNVLSRYFGDVKQHIVKDHKHLNNQAKRDAEAYVKSGTVFEDRQANYEKQMKAQEKLIANAQILCDALEGQQMPDLRDKVVQGFSGDGIGLVKTGDYLRGQAEGAGIWEDEEERRFYENLVDLQDRVPNVLLKDGKKDKMEDEVLSKKPDLAMTNGDVKDIEASSDTKDTADQSTAIVNKSVGAQVDSLLSRLPELQTKDAADQFATDFCFLNSKASRNRLIKAIQEVPKGRSDLLPFYSRIVATLGKCLPDVSQGLVTYLDEEFRSLQRRKQKDFLGSARTINVRYLAELTKFGVVPEHVIFHCLKVSLDDFSRMNIEIIGNLLENCGRYLLRNPDTTPRTLSFLETLKRKKDAQHLGHQERMLIENAMYYVDPPQRAAIQQKERTPTELFIQKLIYVDLNKRTYAKVAKMIRKLHWEETEVVQILEKVFSKPAKVKYSHIYLLADILNSLYRYHQEFVIGVVDNIIEQIIVGLEQNDFKSNQRRIAEARYLGELYVYRMVDSAVVFEMMYRIVTLGHPGGTPRPDQVNALDLPDDFFRARLICTMLDACGSFFDRGFMKKKLDFFMTFFEYYLHTKDNLPMEVDFMVKETFAQIKPGYVMAKSAEQATKAFADAVNQNYKASGADGVAELEMEDEHMSPDEAGDEEPPVPDMDDGESSDDESEKHNTNGPNKDDSDFDEKIVVTRPEEERDPEADAEFDRELAKMQSESLDSRKFDRKPLFDVPLPMRKAQREKSMVVDDSPVEEPLQPPNTVAFSLMTKKGSRQQTKTIAMPSDSQFALAMRDKKEAERAEQQRIKNLVLNYDLQDPASVPTKNGNPDIYLPFDPFSISNPNLRKPLQCKHYRAERRKAHTGPSSPIEDLGFPSHSDKPTTNGPSIYQLNPSLNQSSSNQKGHRDKEEPLKRKGQGQARRLQFSDADWYDPKSS